MNLFFFLKLLGRGSVESAIAKNLGKITLAGWAILAGDFAAAAAACQGQDKARLAAALTSALFEIK